ncbi:MAG: hypothetical protein Q9225_005603, partial [Loekoesia sp. 1 TL-2023]
KNPHPQVAIAHIPAETTKLSRQRQTTPGIRKERRKAARAEKKTQGLQNKPVLSKEHSVSALTTKFPLRSPQEPAQHVQAPSRVESSHLSSKNKNRQPQRILSPEDTEEFSSSSSPPLGRSVSREIKAKLAADDAEVAALEKVLGVKGKKKLPKSFEYDGLDVLLDGLGDDLNEDRGHTKRKRDEGEEWLEAKRKKARRADRQVGTADVAFSSDAEGPGGSFNGFTDEDRSPAYSESDDGLASEVSEKHLSPAGSAKEKVRENPYRAPTTSTTAASKYIPPSLRHQASSETEDISRLRRQIQGLINRLSEVNMISILGDVESLYRNNARQYVSSTLVDLLLGLLCDPAVLQDTFVILHAGFITALYKMIGSDFGAQVVQRVDEEFRMDYERATGNAAKGKKLTNLVSAISYLFTFQMMGSHLVYDYIKLFAKDLSEDTAELLLKCVRSKCLCFHLVYVLLI